jgi:UDP-glucose-4-epimerase GalE
MHFATLAYVGESVAQPELYYDNSVTGTLNLLGPTRRHCVNKLVFSSTCATYGEPETGPIAESHPQRPINPFSRSKLMIEQALSDYALAYGFQSVSLRYFNAAGCDPQGRAGDRHKPETHLIPLMLAEAMRLQRGGDQQSTALRVFGSDFATFDGSCVRDYIHVTDLCQAHLLAAQHLFDGKVQGAEFFNLASGSGFSVLEVIEACRKVTGQPIAYRLEPSRAGDPALLIGGARSATTMQGWQPAFTDLKSIIKTAWSWMTRNPA